MTTSNTDNASRELLDFERIRILYANMKFGYLGVTSGILMLYITVSAFSSSQAANGWLLAVLLANLPRIRLSLHFDRRLRAGTISPANVKPWEARLTWTCVLAYMTTISSIFLPYGAHAADAVLICSLVFMIMAAGGVMMLSTSLPAIVIYLSMIAAAIIVSFLRLPDPIYTWLALIFCVGYFQLLRLIFGQHQMIVENIALKIENSQSALVDPLTQLANRRQLSVVIEKLLPMAERRGDPFCVIMLDLDNFKEFNDAQGHHAGDEQLVRVAGVLRECSRKEDLVVRYGGEEFLMVLPRTIMDDAHVIAERIRAAVKLQTALTISAGVAEYARPQDFEALVRAADGALYDAKKGGRDQVVKATEETGGS